MIERITNQNQIARHKLAEKINELVDAVNELQESQNTYWTDIAEIKKELQTRAENVQTDTESRPENVQDEFAEQRKALDVAVDAIKNATEYLGNQEPLVDVMAMNLHTDLSKALEPTQLTLTEQKDVK